MAGIVAPTLGSVVVEGKKYCRHVLIFPDGTV